MGSGPLANESLERAQKTLARHLRLGGSRIPEELRLEAETLLAETKSELSRNEANRRKRVQLVHRLEDVDNKLRGRPAQTYQLYSNGMLGVIEVWEPVRIRECIDYRRVSEHIERYEARAHRAIERLNWFLARCGIEVEEAPKLKPWEMPYSHLGESREFLWGRIRRGQ
jgi:hypothetical protein